MPARTRTSAIAMGLLIAVSLWGPATWVGAACQTLPLAPTGFDPAVACTWDEDTRGTAAVSVGGDAEGSDRKDNPGVAVSGTGGANHAVVAVSGTGPAGNPDPAAEPETGISISGTGDASGMVGISGTGDARGLAAVSATGDSNAQLVSVSGTGRAGGQTYTGDHPAPYVTISGCEAEHDPSHSEENGQVLTADPARVHVLADAEEVTDPDGDFEPTDVETGAAGTTVQGVTCAP